MPKKVNADVGVGVASSSDAGTNVPGQPSTPTAPETSNPVHVAGPDGETQDEPGTGTSSSQPGHITGHTPEQETYVKEQAGEQGNAAKTLHPDAEPEAQSDRLENAPYGGRIEPGTDLSVLSNNRPNAQGNRYPPDVESLESENASIRRQASDLRTQADALDALADERQKEVDQLKAASEGAEEGGE